MDWLTTGADTATMATGLSVVTATSVWVRRQYREYRDRGAEKRRRNWHGYIEHGGLNEWFVRLAEDPDTPTERVVLDVVDRRGEPHSARADNLRQAVIRDGQLARVPTPDEYAFLRYLRKKRPASDGIPVRYGEPWPDDAAS